MTPNVLKNYIDGEWVESKSREMLDVKNPATAEVIARVPLSTIDEVDHAVQAAKAAFPGWRETTPYTRARYMFELKNVMEDRFEELAAVIVKEHGKIIDEARGEVRRSIENVEVAAGIPSLMTGYNLEDVSQGIDEDCVYQPVGVFCCVTPFNFPLMVPIWFLPYAISCGNTYIVKPSEICPLSQILFFELLDEIDLPPGVVNMVNGDKRVVDALLESPDVEGLSFVGSTPVGKYLYATAAAHGKRAQCQAGAKNCLVVMPDAVLKQSVPAIMSSVFGTAGQRCLAGALVVAVGDVYEPLEKMLVEAASNLKVGDGMDETVQMGPVVSQRSLDRVRGYLEKGIEEGARLLLDGRELQMEEDLDGYFIGPTIFTDVTPEMAIAREEIFGPVMGIIRVDDFDQALEVIHSSPYGNAASIFTTSGKWAREFKYRVQAGNLGINIGIAAPVASFPFSGMKDSFFGDLHGQGRDAIEFFTDRKVVITRWF
ncbi:MAG: methylmalonate-semialdehyde dehydrogenase [Anaerolineae bacterium SM23_ 63]|nr:MAG: methylmalonate-semialdehyde dehydrogenase [Anaerolineae bacterium SM23_ 63]HEY46948.1 CoA-acylating methylmalonate-semialdehyde dehydrogenase [Anaerolineae bacterium]